DQHFARASQSGASWRSGNAGVGPGVLEDEWRPRGTGAGTHRESESVLGIAAGEVNPGVGSMGNNYVEAGLSPAWTGRSPVTTHTSFVKPPLAFPFPIAEAAPQF